ncbi:protein arginine kinase [Bacillus sp. 1P06AnD]|uniref:protein arginine kinase n=1 Tax=Bacillus sp. 1P06AnD TaxID=3132208 RepID=UPI0039A12D9A
MSLKHFIDNALSSWMDETGPEADIVLSSRIRLARNLTDYVFPTLLKQEEGNAVVREIEKQLFSLHDKEGFEFIKMADIQPLEKHILVEKHAISPLLAEDSPYGACLISQDEKMSIMINEEDHIRIQCMLSGLQLNEALKLANELDDQIEDRLDYAFDEKRGYLTSCPTNTGTGLRASVMMHLPGLVLTQQMKNIVPAINQLGLVVRGIYGEGSEALGDIFQISNQITLGKSEIDIVEDLKSVVVQIITQERLAREALVKTSNIQLEDRVYRSWGVLTNARMIDLKEAARCLSDVRLGIDLGYIPNVSTTILNELMILTQPGFLQQYAGGEMKAEERDQRRASFIRERLNMEKDKA